MKIRTDFVTNSSSYNSAEIMIDNPVLLEILKRYEEMTESGFAFKIGSREFQAGPPDILPEDWVPEEKLGFSITPAIYFNETECSIGLTPPEKTDEIIDKIIELLDECHELDADLKNEIKKEIFERKDGINNAHRRIYWEYGECTDEDLRFVGDVTNSWKFTFDRINGAKYHLITTDDETGEVLQEGLWINGKEIKKYWKDSS